MDRVINRPETILKLNAFRIFENENAETEKEKEENLKSIDHMIKVVKDSQSTDSEIRGIINLYGFASVDMPKYN